MKRNIKNVAVIGSGVMGSGIACHFANIGINVLLLDIAPNKLNEKEEKLGLSLESKKVKNRIVNEMFQRCIKSKPAPLYHKNFANRIELGNLTDDLHKISKVDWIIEVVTEKLNIKQIVFKQIEEHRTKGTLITSNTSGIPIKQMNEGRSEDFRKNFAVTHFFNPPRYLKLFEIIPGPDCEPNTIEFLNDFGERFLGKDSVLAKDTPGFIGNRIGTFGMVNILNNVEKLNLTIEEIDKLTGPIIGSPKSATFRTSDVVGLDTTVNVATGIYDNCPNDEFRETFKLPEYIYKMLENKIYTPDGVPRMDNVNYFYSLIYHSKLQKFAVKDTYKERLQSLALSIGLNEYRISDIENDKIASSLLNKFMKDNRYTFCRPIDINVPKNNKFYRYLSASVKKGATRSLPKKTIILGLVLKVAVRIIPKKIKFLLKKIFQNGVQCIKYKNFIGAWF